VSSTKYFTIVLDKTKPILITANQLILDGPFPIPGLTKQNKNLRVQMQASDNLTGISYYHYDLYEITPYQDDPHFLIKSGDVFLGSAGFPSAANSYEATFNVSQTLKTDGEKYYFVIKAVDPAGNESVPITTNIIGLDTAAFNQPIAPVINYPSGIILNRPIMDIDFFDKIIEETKNFDKGIFPGYNQYAFEESLFATTARWMGGMIYNFASSEAWGSVGDWKKYYVKFGKSLTPEEISSSATIIHPLKNVNDPIRIHYRNFRNKTRK
jgi:hypothetical protein